MADSITPSATIELISQQHDSGALSSQSDPVTNPQPSGPQQPSSAQPTVPNANPNPNPQVLPVPTHPPAAFSYAPSLVSGVVVVPPAAPSFRPVPQFSPLPALSYQSPALQPPGVGSASPMAPGVAMSGAGAVPVSQPQSQPLMAYQVQGQPPNPALRHFAPIPNGYAAIPPGPQGALNSMGIPRYPTPYGTVVRPLYPPRPLGTTGMLPTVRPPVVPVPAVRPVIASAVRPVVTPSVTAEKPQTTVYVGKIAPSVENDFILSLLQLCGPVKNWKRAQNPSDGTYSGFGFCEFESAEGVLRALHLLSRFKIDGQELLMKVDQATREYLDRYVEKKTENLKKLKGTPGAIDTKNDDNAQIAVSNDCGKPSTEHAKKNEDGNSADKDITDSSDFGSVTDEDKEADQVTLDKLTKLIEERLKTKPLPPPPPPSQAVINASGNSNSEVPAKSKEGDSDTYKNGEDKNEEEDNSDKPTSENDRRESISPDRSRRNDRRSRERDRERDLKRDKEREIEKYEREAERERYRKEREQRRKMEEAERYYEECLKEWEYREKDKEKQRQYEKEREKERERKRKKEILNDEDDENDDSRKRWRKSVLEEKRKKRLREKEDDVADRHKEEQEVAEAKRKAEEEEKQQQHKDMFKLSTDRLLNGDEKSMFGVEVAKENIDKTTGNDIVVNSNHEIIIGDANLVNGIKDESLIVSDGASDARQCGIAPAKKLGFGLVGSGKRAAVASVFHEEEDDDAEKDKKMRPLVPIDYSTEELQAIQPTATGAAPQNLAAAAAEFAKRISNANIKEEKQETDRDRSRRSNEKRDRERSDDDGARSRTEIKERLTEREKDHRHGLDKHKTSDNKKLLDAKQIIDLIPKTKEELFSYNINWSVYDKNQIHERMRPWISKKITEFLGEEETTLVDYIVSSTQEHVKASQMLELLQSILDEEAEMFVLKMWRMLIYEIKKVETGLESRSK